MSVNLLEMLQSQIGSGVIQQASKFLGEDESAASSAMSAILPSILGSAVQKAATPNGAGGLMDMLSENNFDGSMFNNLGSLLGGGNSTSGLMNIGSTVLKGLTGNKMGALIDVVTSMSGMKRSSSSSLLSMAAPLVMSMIGKVVKSKGLNAGGLAKLLLGQSSFLKSAIPSQISDLMGFGNLGGGLKSNIEDTAAAVGSKVSDSATAAVASGGGFMRKALTWALPVILVLGGLYMVRGCGDNPISDAAGSALNTVTDATTAVTDAAGDAANKAGEVAGNVADAAGDAAGNLADAAGDAAGNVADAAAGAMAALKANAMKALEGVKFTAGSVGESFSNLLSGDEDPIGKSFSFNNLTFASGSSVISADSKMEVENLAAVLNAYSNVKVEIQGHTDNTGNADTNKSLSQERSDAVKAMLEKLGVATDRLNAVGFGADNPVATNDTAEGRKKNRRTEVKITGK